MSGHQFSWLSPRHILFGWGCRFQMADVVRPIAKRLIVVTGSRKLTELGVINELCAHLEQRGTDAVSLGSVHSEPTVRDVDRFRRQLHELNPTADDAIVAIGGGSAIDLAKAVAGLAFEPLEFRTRDYLEGVGTGRTIESVPLPFIAIPTTAGTGAEATKNAVLSGYDDSNRGFKKSLRSDRMMPAVAIVDPELTVSTPQHVTAHSGMDALTQNIESFICTRATPQSSMHALEGARLCFEHLERAYQEPDHQEARTGMSRAALLSGQALANSGLGMAHGIAPALGIHAGLGHGLACAVLLPIAMRVNQKAAADRLTILSQELTGQPDCSTLIEQVVEMSARMQIPNRLTEMGVEPELHEQIVADSRGSSMSGNPQELSDSELHTILQEMG